MKAVLVFCLWLTSSWASCDFANLEAGSSCQETWGVLKGTLHPTQQAVGYAWIQRKLKDFTSPKKAQQTMDGSATPIVIGPGNIPYLIDDHHTLSALNLSGYTQTILTMAIVCNWANETSMDGFYSRMVAANFMFGLGRPAGKPNVLPTPFNLSTIARTLPDLPDDPWRSLAGFARKIQDSRCPSDNKYCLRAYDRICAPDGSGISFFEFRWAYLMNNAFLDADLWDNITDAQVFHNLYIALPADPSQASVPAWQHAAEKLSPLCRGKTAGTYTLPASLKAPLANTRLPGYVPGVDTQIPSGDPDCARASCPSLEVGYRWFPL